MDDRYVKTSPDTKILYNDVNNSYGWATSQPLPSKDFGITNCVFLRGILETDVFAETGYFIEAICVIPKPLEMTLWTSFYTHN